jgi:ATP-dependent DNA helicase RecQ
VDEYQDIDKPQYDLVSALAGRTIADADQRLTIMAVGDDDQNIYSFRGAHVEFIRRFEKDYRAEVHYLVENYRSTRYLIEAANRLIAANTDRMKSEHPIRIDAQRELLPPGGAFGQHDPLTRGRVQRLSIPDETAQATATLTELERLRERGVADWLRIAVLGRTHRELAQVRTLAEQRGIPVRWWVDRNRVPPLHQVREIHVVLRACMERRQSFARAGALIELARSVVPVDDGNPWSRFLHRLLEAWRCESDNAELPVQEAIEFIYESCAEERRDFSYGSGVQLGTVHAAKGTEHDHVVILGAWPADPRPAAREELRRTLYVGMTRARLSLTILDRLDVQPSLLDAVTGPAVVLRDADRSGAGAPLAALQYSVLGLDDIHLGYPAAFGKNEPVHAALAALVPGDPLSPRLEPRGIALCNRHGIAVARLSRKAETIWRVRLNSVRQARVLAMIRRTAEQETEHSFGIPCRIPEWEVPMVEFVHEQGHDP